MSNVLAAAAVAASASTTSGRLILSSLQLVNSNSATSIASASTSAGSAAHRTIVVVLQKAQQSTKNVMETIQQQQQPTVAHYYGWIWTRQSHATTSHSHSPCWWWQRLVSHSSFAESAAAARNERWRDNIARLYARRVLEMAILRMAHDRWIARATACYSDEAAAVETGEYDAFFDNSNTPSDMERKRRLLVQQAAAAAAARPTGWDSWDHPDRKHDWTDELITTLGKTRLERWWAATARIISLSALAAPLTVLIPLSYLHDAAAEWSWQYALWGIEHAGPTFVKLAQWASTRQDLFSNEFCYRFGQLRDKANLHSWEYTQQQLHSNNSNNNIDNTIPWDEYLELDTEPIGSGCIAQVYRGRLRKPVGHFDAGTEVAVKVQHPNIWNKVCIDFYILGKAARWLESIPSLQLHYLSLEDTVTQFRNVMLPQLDLTLEAQHLKRFNQDFASDDHVFFPHPIHELTTTKVLTETFVHGTPILDYVQAPEHKRQELARLGLVTAIKMIILNDFLHGDLHPGNILVNENKKTGKLQLNFLDCGLVVEVGPHHHVNMIKILAAFARDDPRMAGQLMIDASRNSNSPQTTVIPNNKNQQSSQQQKSTTKDLPLPNSLDVDLFIHGVEKVCKRKGNFTEKVGEYITSVCYLACKHRVKLESTLINVALAVEIMEGIATSLQPDLSVQVVALPYLMQAEMMHNLASWTQLRFGNKKK